MMKNDIFIAVAVVAILIMMALDRLVNRRVLPLLLLLIACSCYADDGLTVANYSGAPVYPFGADWGPSTNVVLQTGVVGHYPSAVGIQTVWGNYAVTNGFCTLIVTPTAAREIMSTPAPVVLRDDCYSYYNIVYGMIVGAGVWGFIFFMRLVPRGRVVLE